LNDSQLQSLREYYADLASKFSDSEYIKKAVELLAVKKQGILTDSERDKI